jgi:hypothetical protein
LKEEERKGAVPRRGSRIFWGVLIVLSIVPILAVRDTYSLLSWIVSFAALGGVVLFLRIGHFSRSIDNLLKKGQSLEPYSYARQTQKLILVFIFVLIAFFGPLLLTDVVGFSIWVGVLVGVLDGWMLQLLVYSLYLSRWQIKQKGKLYSVQIWNGTKVQYTGLSFEKEGDSESG